MVDYCTEHDIGFIPWYPLSVGKLADHPGLVSVAESNEATPAQIALAWLLHRSSVMLPIPGTTSVKHLEENWRVADIELKDQEMEQLDELAESSE